MKFRYSILLGALLAVAFTGCKKEDTDPNADLKTDIKEAYAAIVFASYEDSYNTAVILHDAIDDYVDNPSAASLETAKMAWLDSREPYGQTEAYRFGEGPIDDADGPEGLLNAWPLDESYIDYVTGSPNTGIVNDGVTTIDAATLEGLNEVGSEENISIGYHAIEFLLWGQDDPNTALQTPGQRPFTDFLTDGTGTAANQERRCEYLKVCADLLLVHLQSLLDEWNPNGGNYYNTFIGLDNDEALRRMLTGIGILSKSELAGERIFTALDNQNQEDEHSCFADNTDRDIITNAEGIRNVYLGTYTRVNGVIVSGPSLSDLGFAVNNDQNDAVLSALNDALMCVNAIPDPFDFALTQESVGGNGPISRSVTSLQNLGDQIAEMSSDFGITISTDLPD